MICRLILNATRYPVFQSDPKAPCEFIIILIINLCTFIITEVVFSMSIPISGFVCTGVVIKETWLKIKLHYKCSKEEESLSHRH